MRERISPGKHTEHYQDTNDIAAEARDTFEELREGRTGESEESRLQRGRNAWLRGTESVSKRMACKHSIMAALEDNQSITKKKVASIIPRPTSQGETCEIGRLVRRRD